MEEFLSGLKFGQALLAAGIIPPNTIRAVIDIPAGGKVVIHLEMLGDKRLLEIVPALQGHIEIRRGGDVVG